MKTWQIIQGITLFIVFGCVGAIYTAGDFISSHPIVGSNGVDPELWAQNDNTFIIGVLACIACAAFLVYTLITKRGYFDPTFGKTVPNSAGFSQLHHSNPVTPQPPPTDIQLELQKAADMLKSGLIDEDEYKQLKQKIISKS